MSQPFQIKNNEEQYRKLEMTLKKRGHLRGGRDPTPEALDRLMGAYSEKAAHDQGCLNPYSNERWVQCHFGEPFPQPAPPSQLCCVTILPQVGWIDLNIPRTGMELHREFLKACTKVQQKCRNLGAGKFDFLLSLDAGFIVVNGVVRVLAVHAHGFAWGELSAIKANLRSLPAAIGGTPGGKAVICSDRRGWLTYMSKDSRIKSIRNQDSDGSWLPAASRHFTKDDQLTLIEAYGDLKKPEMSFASGVGVQLLRAARQAALKGGYIKPAGNRWKLS